MICEFGVYRYALGCHVTSDGVCETDFCLYDIADFDCFSFVIECVLLKIGR